MTVSISGGGTLSSIYASPSAVQGASAPAAASPASTTLGAEQGAAAVVYEPGPAQKLVALTYSNRDKKRRDQQNQSTIAELQSKERRSQITAYWEGQKQQLANEPKNDNAKLVKATGGTTLPPPDLPQTPGQAAASAESKNVWAPVKPILTGMPEGWAKSTPIATRPPRKG